jgi:hypothetical protein
LSKGSKLTWKGEVVEVDEEFEVAKEGKQEL